MRQEQEHWTHIDVLEAIRMRRSIRKYSDLPVEWDKVGTVIDAGRLAPSAGNLQSWRFVVVEAAGRRKALAEACMNQFWMETAPVHIVIVMMMKKIKDFYGKRAEFYASQDSAMAAQNIMLAAHSIGLGSCFVSAFDEESIIEMFNLPEGEGARPFGIVTLGYPAEAPQEPIKYRLENVIFLGKWGGQNAARMRDFDNILWNFRVAERAIKLGENIVKAVDVHTRQGRKGFLEKLKQHTSEIKKKIEESGKKKAP